MEGSADAEIYLATGIWCETDVLNVSLLASVCTECLDGMHYLFVLFLMT